MTSTYARGIRAIAAMALLAPAGCASRAPAIASSADAWRTLLQAFPECHSSMMLDERAMERRLGTHGTHLQSSLVRDAGIADDTRLRYPVCRYSPEGAGFVALLVESRGGAGGRDEEYRLLTRTLDGAPIADVVVAAASADCSFFYQLEALIALPAVRTTASKRTFDCDEDVLLSTDILSRGSIAIGSDGTITEQIIEE